MRANVAECRFRAEAAASRQGAAMSLLNNIKALLRPSKVDVRARFEILRESMSGTMSSFYKARDRQFDRIVGLKLLDPAKTAAFEARFPA